MTRDHHDDGDLFRRVALIGAATVGMIFLIRAVAAKRETASEPIPVTVEMAATPIAAEADVFSRAVTSPANADRRTSAHPRTLATFRALRAYPGAPPRVPHGLTAGELRTSHCNTCHQRGGYVARFAAYAPVTPHPEMAACLQCHAVDDAIVGVALPDAGPNAVCRQCHDPGGERVAGDVEPGTWVAPPPTVAGMPPLIPHELQLRGDCNACHAGPAAVAEIRTTHPERADCRQCHVMGSAAEPPFIRSGGAP